MVGMDMRVDGLDQTQVQLTKKLEIAVDLLEHRIDDQGLATAAAGKDVTVGAGCLIEQLPENHESAPIIPRPDIVGEANAENHAAAWPSNCASPYPTADVGAGRLHIEMSWTVRSHISRT
jgi:hypothetical protein